MPAAYPVSIKTFPLRQDQVDIVPAVDFNGLADEVVAIEHALGLNPGESTKYPLADSVVERLTYLDAAVGALEGYFSVSDGVAHVSITQVTGLTSELNDLDSGLADEITARTSADAALDARLTTEETYFHRDAGTGEVTVQRSAGHGVTFLGTTEGTGAAAHRQAAQFNGVALVLDDTDRDPWEVRPRRRVDGVITAQLNISTTPKRIAYANMSAYGPFLGNKRMVEHEVTLHFLLSGSTVTSDTFDVELHALSLDDGSELDSVVWRCYGPGSGTLSLSYRPELTNSGVAITGYAGVQYAAFVSRSAGTGTMDAEGDARYQRLVVHETSIPQDDWPVS